MCVYFYILLVNLVTFYYIRNASASADSSEIKINRVDNKVHHDLSSRGIHKNSHWREIFQVWNSNVIYPPNFDSNFNLNPMCQRQVYSIKVEIIDLLLTTTRTRTSFNSKSENSYTGVQILTRVSKLANNQNETNFRWKSPKVSVLHFSLYCVNALIFLDESEIDNDSGTQSEAQMDYTIKIVQKLWSFLFKSESPRFTHHVFVGKRKILNDLLNVRENLNADASVKQKQVESEENLNCIKILKFVKDLKYKTGIAIDDFDFDENSEANRNSKSALILNPDFIKAFPHHDFTKASFSWENITALKFGWRNVRNVHLRADGFPAPVYITRDEKGRPYAGVSIKILDSLSHHHNLTYTWTANHFRNLGRNPKNPEKWDGFIGALEQDVIDAAFYMADTADRHPYATFTTTLFFMDLNFYTALPEVRVKWQAIVYPFEPSVWFLILLSVAATAPIFYAQQKLFRLQKPQATIISKLDSGSNSPFFTALILPICALLMESFPAPKNMKMRPLLGLFLFYSIIVGVFYNSNLISFLTFPEEEKYPKTFSDLAQMPEYHSTLMDFPGSPCDIFFRRTTHPTFLEIKKRLKRDRSWAKCAISAALEKKPFPSVCFGYDVGLESLISKNLTAFGDFGVLKKSTEKVLAVPVSIALQKESKYFDVLNSNFGALRDTGHYSKWMQDVYSIERKRGRQWIKASAKNDYRSDSDTKLDVDKKAKSNAAKVLELSRDATESTCKPFTMENFVVAFACMILGAAFGTIGFLFEILNCQKLFLKGKLDK